MPKAMRYLRKNPMDKRMEKNKKSYLTIGNITFIYRIVVDMVIGL